MTEDTTGAKRLKTLVKEWIQAEYYVRTPTELPKHLELPATWKLIQTEDALREATTGEGELIRAAAVVGVGGALRAVERGTRGTARKVRKKKIVRERLEDDEDEDEKPARKRKGKGKKRKRARRE